MVGETFVDFRIVKEQVTMDMVLGHYGIHLRPSNRTSLRGKCPLPTHTSATSKESFSVQTDKNIWACQSSSCAAERHGKRGGNVLDFVALMENCSVRDAALKLHNWFLSVPSRTQPATQKNAEVGNIRTSEQAPKLVSKIEEGEGNKPLAFTLKDIDHTHPYIASRGVEDEVAKEFGIGFFPGRGSMMGRIVFPIQNEQGELVAYAGRSIDETEPKYKFPTGFHKSEVLFNLHRHVGAGVTTIIVVEGFFDCIHVHQAGYPCVALLGSSLSREQEQLLRDHFTGVVVMLDSDAAGRTATDDCLVRLGRGMWVKGIMLPDGMQPDNLSSAEIKTILG